MAMVQHAIETGAVWSACGEKPSWSSTNSTGEIFEKCRALKSGTDHLFRIQTLAGQSGRAARLKLLTRNEKDFIDIPGLDGYLPGNIRAAAGRRSRPDFVAEAVILAKGLGKPVKTDVDPGRGHQV